MTAGRNAALKRAAALNHSSEERGLIVIKPRGLVRFWRKAVATTEKAKAEEGVPSLAPPYPCTAAHPVRWGLIVGASVAFVTGQRHRISNKL